MRFPWQPNRNRQTRRARGVAPQRRRGLYCLVALALVAGRTWAAGPLPNAIPIPSTPLDPIHPATFVQPGSGNAFWNPQSATLTQYTPNVQLNWAGFNIGSNATVTFNQPSVSSIAINHIWDSNPSQIFGHLTANGQVYLLNQNGFIFGPTAQINVGTLVASALDITPAALSSDIGSAINNNFSPAFQAFTDSTGNPIVNGSITVMSGANLQGQQIFLFAPNVANSGHIETTDGQAILAAGSSIYIMQSSTGLGGDFNGYIVEVNDSVASADLQNYLNSELTTQPGGGVTQNPNATLASASVTNNALGQIISNHGNVSLIGLAVNQEGLVSATSSISVNGSIRLVARDTVGAATTNGSNKVVTGTRTGAVILGANSVTEVRPDLTDTHTDVDKDKPLPSKVIIDGRTIFLDHGASITATSGDVSLTANDPLVVPSSNPPPPNDSWVYLADGSSIDVSGAQISLPMSSNLLTVQLRTPELLDSPLQTSLLYGQTITVDLRQHGTRADGSTWIGTPLVDLSGDVANIPRTVTQRSTTGGTVTIDTEGSAVISAGADINLSGGVVHYTAGYVQTTQLLSHGTVYDIANASPNLIYSAFANTFTVNHKKWGVTQSWNILGGGNGRFQNAYDVGMDAGTFTLIGPQLVLDGNVYANGVIGPYQRNSPIPLQADQLFRQPDEVPLGAQLVIGDASVVGAALPNYNTPNVQFSVNKALSGQSFNPVTDAFPADITALNLLPSLVQNGVSRVAVYSNGSIDLPASVALDLPAGGSLALTGNAIDIEGQIRAHAGSVSLLAGQTAITPPTTALLLGASASIDVSGGWVNDQLAGSATAAPVLINGGTVTLSKTGGTLNLDRGSVIDVSGGAWLQANGKIVNGNGGTISVTAQSIANVTTPVALGLGATLRGYAPGKGGTLNIAASGICIGLSCSDGVLGQLNLNPEFFSQDGFDSYKLTSDLNSLEILGDASIVPRAQTLVLDSTAAAQPTGTELASFSHPVVLPDALRTPVNLEFDVAPNSIQGVSQLSQLGILTMDTGARILADPGASVNFNSSTRLYIDGTINSPAGSINVGLDNGLNIAQYFPGQSLWFGPDASLNVAGVAQLQPNASGLTQGQVLPGGTVNIDAKRGYVAAQAGAQIDVSGTSAAIDLLSPSGTVDRTSIVSDAGNVNITASEGVLFDGTLLGHAGGPGAAGGGFSLTLDTSNNDFTNISAPLAARTIIVGDGGGARVPTGLTPGDPLPVDGQAPVNAAAIVHGGFDALTFVSRSFDSSTRNAGVENGPAPAGLIQFQSGTGNALSLALGRSLTLDAANLSLDPNTSSAKLSAPYIAFGDSGTTSTLQPSQLINVPSPNPSAGSGVLEFDGQLIDILGSSVTQNINTVTLNSTGDIRLRGLQIDSGRTLTGYFETAGDLILNAAQVYPTSLSSFMLQSTGLAPDPNNPGMTTGTIRFQAQGQPTPVLEGGGQLIVQAPFIDQEGVVKAPLGEIDLIATPVNELINGISTPIGGSLTLGSSSLTSTSADGQLIPFGQLQGNFAWAYFPGGQTLNGQQTLAFGETDPLPQKRVSLKATAISVAKNATIDVSGGGDFFAYEFNQGVLSSQDILSNLISPNTFAILPGLNPQYAPYDTEAYIGSALQPGNSVYLSGGIPGLQPGQYALLPASYALLPGAYLVTAVSGYQDLLPSQSVPLTNGATVVSGYRTVAGTDIRSARTSGFAVQPGSSISAEASYTTATASQFFTQLAATNGTAVSRLPQDAGVVAFNAGQTLSLAGSLLGTTTGRGAAVDINATQIEVVPQVGAAQTVAGALQLGADQLNAFGAESLLLGATRTDTSSGTELSVDAIQVTVDSGVKLQAPELMLAAKDTINVDSGSQLTASGTLSGTPSNILIGDSNTAKSGNGALLRLSAGPQAQLGRGSNDATSGTLNIDGATLKADGSMILDATSNLVFASSANLIDHGALTVGAGSISLGDGASPGGFVLSSAAIANLGVTDLTLHSYSSLNLYGDVALNTLNSLSLETGAITTGVSNTQATLSTNGDLSWSNPNSPNPGTSTITGGNLVLHGHRVLLGDGTYVANGFSNVTIEADQEIVTQGSTGSLGVAGSLILAAPRLTGAANTDITITAGDGNGNYFPLAIEYFGQNNPSTTLPDLGARLTLTGSSITQAGNIDLPSGSLTLAAKGLTGVPGQSSPDVVLASGSQTLVGGSTKTYNGTNVDTNVYAPGGSVTLSSDNGNVNVQSGAQVNVAGGPDGGDAGTLTVSAPTGNVQLDGQIMGTAQAGYNGASVSLDANEFDISQPDGSVRSDFSALNSVLASAGFTDSLTLRQRQGNIIVADTVTAQNIDLSADNGDISVSGKLDASGAKGGNVTLNAQTGISLHGAVIDVNATGAGQDGGRVALDTSKGGIQMDASSTINVSGGGADPATGTTTGADGQVALRLPQAPGDLANPQLSLAGQIISRTNSSQTTIEEFKTYNYTAGVITNGTDHNGQIVAADTLANLNNPLWNDANNFMNNPNAAPGIVTTLASSMLGNVQVVPGIEIDSQSNLALNSTWNFLTTWKFPENNGTTVGGVLTLRAAGNLNINSTITDNFDSNNLLQPGPSSWSYRLVAGADLNGASPLALGSSGSGNFTLAAGTPSNTATAPKQTAIRTGAADIAIAAAGNIVLANSASVIYTGGNATTGIALPALSNLPYPQGSSDINVYAQGDIIGAPSSQLFTGWLYRAGRPVSSKGSASATGWTVAFNQFQQGIGALAGGDVNVQAGGSINDLLVSIPTIGLQDGGTTPGNSQVNILGGGNLQVTAGGDIASGIFYTGRGNMTVRAGGSLTSDRTDSRLGHPVYTILGLGDGRADVTARADLALETVVNPTLVAQGLAPGQGVNPSVFSTYSPNSAVYLSAIGGNITLSNDSSSLVNILPSKLYSGSNAQVEQALLTAYPPFLQAAALSGNIDILNSMTLYPAPQGNLELLASGSVSLVPNTLVAVSDADPNLLPDYTRPAIAYNGIAGALNPNTLNQGSGGIPADASVPVHQADSTTALVISLTGDVAGVPSLGTGFLFANPAEISAGLDVVNLTLVAQNMNASDVTTVTAGRDIIYSNLRDPSGNVGASTAGIVVDGPGQLIVQAGRNVDLAASDGISTRGNTVNPALPSGGANITVLTGAAGKPDYAGFIQRYFSAGQEYSDELTAYMQALTNNSSLTPAAALTAFENLPLAQQQPMVLSVFYAELRASGEAEAHSRNTSDYNRGFDAVSALYPSAPASYAGDLTLYFSKIYTYAGGDINLVVPGGMINAGLSMPPTSFGLNPTKLLGIVAESTGSVNGFSYSDFQVNASRVFAADGGNIVLWSSTGSIDAGRGAKTAITVPPPILSFANGKLSLTTPPSLQGSGIREFVTTPGTGSGVVDLFAPVGSVNAGDAGIGSEGNLNIAAQQVIGADNIQVSGASTGVPVANVGGLGAGLSGTTSLAAAASNVGNDVAQNLGDQNNNGFLGVEVMGFGDESPTTSESPTTKCKRGSPGCPSK
ncbi:MAG: filamentous hemagglutinin family protein [Sulfuricaulis sp.]